MISYAYTVKYNIACCVFYNSFLRPSPRHVPEGNLVPDIYIYTQLPHSEIPSVVNTSTCQLVSLEIEIQSSPSKSMRVECGVSSIISLLCLVSFVTFILGEAGVKPVLTVLAVRFRGCPAPDKRYLC